MEYETKNMDGQPSRPVPKLDETKKVPEGELHKPVPRGRLGAGFQTGELAIKAMLESGGPLSPHQYNTPPSAILLAGETEMISRLQNARKDALGVFRSQLARMMIEQFIKADKGKGELLVGKRGKRVKYSASKLGNPDDYTISYLLTVKSKRQELANLAEFAAVYDKLPLKWNLENILMADDPDGIINDLELQRAKQINPALSLLEMALKYARAANDTEDEVESEMLKLQSKILTHEYVMMMRQRLQPQTAPVNQPEPPKGNSQLLTTLAAGAMRGEGGDGGRPVQPQGMGVQEQ
jgi:hypothetical protein